VSPGRNRLTSSADRVRRLSLRDRSREGAGTGRGRPGDASTGREGGPEEGGWRRAGHQGVVREV